MIITIDGASGTGKSSLAALIGHHYKWQVLYSGMMYRFVAWCCQTEGMHNIDSILRRGIPTRLEHAPLTCQSISELASKLASMKKVRDALCAMQRIIVARHTNIVLEGRDMGTNICPHASIKIFLHTDPDIKAQRRLKQLQMAHGTAAHGAAAHGAATHGTAAHGTAAHVAATHGTAAHGTATHGTTHGTAAHVAATHVGASKGKANTPTHDIKSCLSSMQERDKADTQRTHNPLIVPWNAKVFDTSKYSFFQLTRLVIHLIDNELGK